MRLRHTLLLVATLGVVVVALATALRSPVAGGRVASTAKLRVTVRDLNEPWSRRSSIAARVTSRRLGIGCPGACVTRVQRGSKVALNVRIRHGYRFTGWRVYRGSSSRAVQNPPPGCRRGGTCLLALTSDMHVVARMLPIARLELQTSGAGRLVARRASGKGHTFVCSDDDRSNDLRHATRDLALRIAGCVFRFPPGARVRIRAIPDRTVPGARLIDWRGSPCDDRKPVCTLTMRGTHHLTARFDPVFLEIGEGTFGLVSVKPARPPCIWEADPVARGLRTCRTAFSRGTRVTLTRPRIANPVGYWVPEPATREFCWRKVLKGGRLIATKRRVCRFTLRASLAVVAGSTSTHMPGFTGGNLSIEYVGPPGGRILVTSKRRGRRLTCPRNCMASFERREVVVIRAISRRKAQFVRWGDSSNPSSVRRLVIGDEDRTVRAFFRRP